MPWTLYRYILKDLLKLLVFTTVVLTVVISFAASIKPMSEGLLSPGSMFRFIIYTVPTMIQFAVPFAGTFAGTMVFNRMVNDNEILACAAGGISYRALLVPVILLGLTLMIGLFYMSNLVVPTFYQQAARMIRKDFMSLVVRQVKRQETVEFGNWLLYADDAFEYQKPPYLKNSELQPQQMITLTGVALARLGKKAPDSIHKFQLEDLSTAGRADLLLFNDNDETWMTLRLKDTTVYPNDTAKAHIEEGRVSPIRLPSPLQDDPSFKTLSELYELGEHPDLYFKVRAAKRRLAKACAAEDLAGKLFDDLRKGQATLIAQDTRYRITAPFVRLNQLNIRLRSKRQIPIIVLVNQGGVRRRHSAASALLVMIDTGSQQEPAVRITLLNVKTQVIGRQGPSSESETIELEPVYWSQSLTEPLLAQDWQTLVENASTSFHTNGIAAPSRILQYQVNRLGHKIIAQLNYRAAYALIGPLLLLLGALLSMANRGKLPLVVFFWSFLISVIGTVTMLSGKAMTDDPSMWIPTSVFVIWSGNILIFVLLIRLYTVIRKN